MGEGIGMIQIKGDPKLDVKRLKKIVVFKSLLNIISDIFFF